jgi:predicted transcriptional regulator
MDETKGLEILEAIRSLGERIERSLDDLRRPPSSGGVKSAFKFSAPVEPENASHEQFGKRRVRPPLPDPRLVRQIIRHRQLRARFFDGSFFADPAWDMLLDLTAARAEKKRIQVTSLCIASGVPPTTALRWINVLVNSGLVERLDDDQDHRRSFISLTEKGANQMAEYFSFIGDVGEHLV